MLSNPQTGRIFGSTLVELIGQTLESLGPERLRSKYSAPRRALRDCLAERVVA
jgi:hypothetical protein